MDPELPRLWSPGRPAWAASEPLDETEPLRRTVRFVWTSATLVGVCGRALSAAAAAADESEGGPDSRRLKADRAAVAAFGFAVDEVRGCIAATESLA